MSINGDTIRHMWGMIPQENMLFLVSHIAPFKWKLRSCFPKFAMYKIGVAVTDASGPMYWVRFEFTLYYKLTVRMLRLVDQGKTICKNYK